MKKALSSAEAHPMASMLDARSINWFSAALVREMAKESAPSEFEEAFGATPERAEEIIAQWELCAMPYWGAEELAGVILAADPTRSPKIVSRSIEMAQKAGEVPEAFKPAEGIQWAMARGFAMESTLATLVGVAPGVYGGPQSWPSSARLVLAPPREELADDATPAPVAAPAIPLQWWEADLAQKFQDVGDAIHTSRQRTGNGKSVSKTEIAEEIRKRLAGIERTGQQRKVPAADTIRGRFTDWTFTPSS